MGIAAFHIPEIDVPQYYGGWKRDAIGAAHIELNRLGYFKIIKLESHNALLEAIALNELEITPDLIARADERDLKSLLFLELLQSPVFSCKTTSRVVTSTRCTSYDENNNCQSYQTTTHTVYTSTLTTQLSLEANLVNIKTGNRLSKHSQYKSTLSTEAQNCLPDTQGLRKATRNGVAGMMSNFSPQMITLAAPLSANLAGTPEDQEDETEEYLKDGIVLAEEKKYDDARRSWEKALRASNAESAAAHWNLGIYHWYRGEVLLAEKYLTKARELGGGEFMNKGMCLGVEKNSTLGRFTADKNRILTETQSKKGEESEEADNEGDQ